MLDSIRSMIGLAPPPPSSSSAGNSVLERKREAAKETPHLDRLSTLAKAQDMQIACMKDELHEVQSGLKYATSVKNVNEMRSCLARGKELQAEMSLLEKKRVNTYAQLRAIQTADSNLDQALLVKEGAHELKQTVDAMEDIGLEDAVDQMQDAAAMVTEHNDLLTAPLFPSDAVEDDEVDAELRALLRQQEDSDIAAKMTQMPTAKRPVVAKEEEGEHEIGETAK